jgi:tetratricopeptide (TPR) repeat protein
LLALDWRPMDYQINGALDMLPSVLTALRAAQQLQEPALLAELHRDAALRYSQLKDFPPAQEHLAAAVELFRQIGHRAAESHAQRNMALLYERQGRNAEMLAPAERAVTIARAAASGEALAVALATLGHVYMHLERHRDAIPVLEQALRLMTEIGITTNQAEALTSLSYAHLHVGEAGPAVAYSQRALDMQRALDDRRGQLSTLPDHGDALLAAGDLDGARIAWETFLAMVRDVRTPGGVPIRLPFDPQEVADQVRAKLAKLGEAASDQPAGRRHGIGTSPAPPPS